MAKIQWHPAFCAAMQLELRDNPFLSYASGFNLNEKPLELDLLIIKKPPETKIYNQIGEMFREHNIVEYKSVTDHKFNSFAIAQALSYACYYCDRFVTWDVTLTLVVSKAHFNLLRWLEEHETSYVERHKGIYDIKLLNFLDVQLVVTEEIDNNEFKWLSSLTDKITKEQAENVLMASDDLKDQTNRMLAKAVMYVVSSANEIQFDNVTKEKKSMEAYLRIVKPQIDEQMRNNNIKIVKKMIQRGADNEFINFTTEMSESEIEELRKEVMV